MLKELLQARNTREENKRGKKKKKENYKNKPKTVKKMAVEKLILILILKVNG